VSGVNYKRNGLQQTQLFSVFDFQFIKGDKVRLKEPYSLVLTESMSKKYFNEKDPIGQLIKGETPGHGKGAGAYDISIKSHLQFDLIFSDLVSDDGESLFSSWKDFRAYRTLS
jgi:putative ABC transport system permease protein